MMMVDVDIAQATGDWFIDPWQGGLVGDDIWLADRCRWSQWSASQAEEVTGVRGGMVEEVRLGPEVVLETHSQ
jgi:hypothetical protein